MSVEDIVRERYSGGAREKQESLCCPVTYDRELLALLPEEIIEKDYGCGDPSRYVRRGDTVVDLGSGGGKICYMAAQIVGAEGRVIGIDMTDDMLALARRHQAQMAAALGYDVVEFRKGYIQQLGELVASESVDLVISNCVLNLVAEQDRAQLMQGLFQVLKPGGRIAISDIVCTQAVSQELREDPELWTGCIAGAFQQDDFLSAFAEVGFVDLDYDKWDDQPWRVIDNLHFHSATVCGRKPGGQASNSGCCA
jgi:SAM-dependent methyltransferase